MIRTELESTMKSLADSIFIPLTTTSSDSTEALQAMFSICSECWMRSVALNKAYYDKNCPNVDAKTRAKQSAIDAQCVWETLVDYIKSEYQIEYNRLGFIMYMKYWLSYIKSVDNQEGKCDELIKICECANEYIIDFLERREKSNTYTTINKALEKPELLKRYFALMDELKVFRTDPSTYETDHERELHNEIMDIFNTIIG